MNWHQRFITHFVRGQKDECWPWLSSKNDSGYGRFMLDGKARIASRLSYEIHCGPIPGDMDVLHKCDNPACVNPGHLFVGSHADNMRDRNTKGRARGGAFPGETHPRAKLTNQLANEIKHLARSGTESQRSIARRYGLSQSHVSALRHGDDR